MQPFSGKMQYMDFKLALIALLVTYTPIHRRREV